jgi:hypothetical protein
MYPLSLSFLLEKVRVAYMERRPVMGASDDDFGGHASAKLSAKVAVLQDVSATCRAVGQDYLPLDVIDAILGADV